MSIWHEELEIGLWSLEDLPLGSAGLTTVVSNLLSRAGVYHQCRVGYVKDNHSQIQAMPHCWVELQDGWCIDLTVRHWLYDENDIPHGVFQVSDFPRVSYHGAPLQVAGLDDEELEAMTNGRHTSIRIPSLFGSAA